MTIFKLFSLLIEYGPKALPLLEKLFNALEAAKSKQQLLGVPEDQIDSEVDKHVDSLATLLSAKK
jgi:hypothetical protein